LSKALDLKNTGSIAPGFPPGSSIFTGQRLQEVESAGNIVVIEKRALIRECLTDCFRAAFGLAVISFSSVEEWREVKDQASASIVVLSTGGRARSAEAVQTDISLLSRVASPMLLILLADAEEPGQIVDALERGARGYIPTSASLAIAIEAVRLVRAGGVYVPAGSLIAANRKSAAGNNGKIAGGDIFTDRQTAVLDALCKGKANKTIAYELSMRESTVKVHIRNIMKKLGAKNRTEVAYMAQTRMGREGA
jgi:DNA-binding NarL/FixJ family response regulator